MNFIFGLVVLISSSAAFSATLKSYEISGFVVGFDQKNIEIRSGNTLYSVSKEVILAEPKVGSEITFRWSDQNSISMKRYNTRSVASTGTRRTVVRVEAKKNIQIPEEGPSPYIAR